MRKLYLKISVFIVALLAVVLGFSSIKGNPALQSISAIEPPSEASSFAEGSVVGTSDIESGPSEASIVKAPIYGVYSFVGERYAGALESKKWPIASITKLMTALVARDVIAANEKIKLDPEIFAIEDIGFSGGFSPGEIFSRYDLEEALLVVSSNVAAEAMARFYGREKFIDTMNSFAYKIGMLNTYFEDPTGLSYKDQSTAEDLNKLASYILKNAPEIFKLTRTKTGVIYDYKSGKKRMLNNINNFAGRADFIGGKTGTTPEAVGNLVSLFSRDNGKSGRIVILLGTEDRYNETDNLLKEWH